MSGYDKATIRKVLRDWAVNDPSNNDIVKNALCNLCDALVMDAAEMDMNDEVPLSEARIPIIANDIWRARSCILALSDVFDD